MFAPAQEAMTASMRYAQSEAQVACVADRYAMSHIHRERERHASLVQCEAGDLTLSAKSEVERRHKDAVVARMGEAENIHATPFPAFRAEIEEAAARFKGLGMKVVDLVDRRLATGSRILKLTNGESSPW